MRIWALASCSTLVALAACTANRPASQDSPKVTSSEEGPSAALDSPDKDKALQSDLSAQIKKAVAPPETEVSTPPSRTRVSNPASVLLQERLQRLRAQSNRNASLQTRPSFSRQLSPSSQPRITNTSRLVASNPLPQQRVSQSTQLPTPVPNAPAAPRASTASPTTYAAVPLPRPTTPNTSTASVQARTLGPTARVTPSVPEASSPSPVLSFAETSSPVSVSVLPPADSRFSEVAATQADELPPTASVAPVAVTPAPATTVAVAPTPALPRAIAPIETSSASHQHLATLDQPLLEATTKTPTLHGGIAPQFSPTSSLPTNTIAPVPSQTDLGQAESPQSEADQSIQSRLRQLRQNRLPESLPLYEGQENPTSQSGLLQSAVCQTSLPQQLSQMPLANELAAVEVSTEQGKSLLAAQEGVAKPLSKAETCAGDTNELAQSMPEAATAGTPIPGRVESPTRYSPAIGVALPGNTP